VFARKEAETVGMLGSQNLAKRRPNNKTA
jgi:hypothetical protein